MFEKNKYAMNEQTTLELSKESYLVVDVRSPMEFSGRRLGIAVNVPYLDIISGVHQLPKNKKILCYCNYGNRGGRSADALRAQGYEAYVLSGMEVFSPEFIEKFKD